MPHLLSRRNLLRSAAVGAALASGLSPGPGSRAASSHGIVGRRAPDLAVDTWIGPDGESTTFDMAETTGKWVYLKCFQSWCPGCHKYGLPALKRVSDEFHDDDRFLALAVQTVFEGFSVNTRSQLRETQLRYDLAIKMGHDAGDPDGDHTPQTMRSYRTGGTPWVVIIDPQAQVIFNDFHINPDRFIEFLRFRLG